MKVKTAELEGVMLDWAVAKAIGLPLIGAKLNTSDDNHLALPARYSTEWGHGGKLIESRTWALPYRSPAHSRHLGAFTARTPGEFPWHGPTLLIAACRAIVAAELGEEVEIPDELCGS